MSRKERIDYSALDSTGERVVKKASDESKHTPLKPMSNLVVRISALKDEICDFIEQP